VVLAVCTIMIQDGDTLGIIETKLTRTLKLPTLNVLAKWSNISTSYTGILYMFPASLIFYLLPSVMVVITLGMYYFHTPDL
jgi:hypothetical protein